MLVTNNDPGGVTMRIIKRLAIFDMDGTLLNTLDDLANACNHALRENGFPAHPNEAYRYFAGDGIHKLVERSLPLWVKNDETVHARVKEAFDVYYGAHSEDLTKPYDGVLETLDAMRAQGTCLAVLSNKPHEFVTVLAKKYFGERFAVAHGQRAGYPRKPDASLVKEIVELTGTGQGDCIYCGDSGVDMQTAKNGGVYAIGALWGFRDGEELLKNGADALAESFPDLLKFSHGTY